MKDIFLMPSGDMLIRKIGSLRATRVSDFRGIMARMEMHIGSVEESRKYTNYQRVNFLARV